MAALLLSEKPSDSMVGWLFCVLKTFLTFLGQTLSKAIVRDVICYGRIQTLPQGSGKEKMKKPFRNFFKKFPERLPKPKICEVIIYEKENARESGPDLRKGEFA